MNVHFINIANSALNFIVQHITVIVLGLLVVWGWLMLGMLSRAKHKKHLRKQRQPGGQQCI